MPRAVEHAATFRSKQNAAAAAEQLDEVGFQVTARRRLFRTTLDFSEARAVDQESAAAFTRQVVPIVEQHGGVYDGWGALLVEA